MSLIADRIPDLSTVGAGVLIRGGAVRAATDSVVPGIQAGDFVRDETRIAPIRAPKDSRRLGDGQDVAAVPRHVRIGLGRLWLMSSCPVNASHRRLGLLRQ